MCITLTFWAGLCMSLRTFQCSCKGDHLWLWGTNFSGNGRSGGTTCSGGPFISWQAKTGYLYQIMINARALAHKWNWVAATLAFGLYLWSPTNYLTHLPRTTRKRELADDEGADDKEARCQGPGLGPRARCPNDVTHGVTWTSREQTKVVMLYAAHAHHDYLLFSF